MALALTTDEEVTVLRESVKLSDADRLILYKRLGELRIERARKDPAAFVEYILSSENTGRPIRNAPFHIEWQKFFSTVRRGVISAAIEHGKTQQIGIGRLLWEIGRNPRLRCLLIGASDEAAEKTLGHIRRHIETNERLHRVFPNLRRSSRKGDPWTDHNIRVEGAGIARDPTIQARSVGSRNVLGSRTDLAVIDDMLNVENTRSKGARDHTDEWFHDVVMTRIYDDVETGIYGRVFWIGNPFDSDDEMARLARLKGWQSMVTAAVLNPDGAPDRWVPTWPAAWTMERIFERRDSTPPHVFARKYLCRVLDASNRRFLRAWIEHSYWLGRGRYLIDRQPTENGTPMRCFSALDPGFGKKDADALSSLITTAVDHSNRRVVVNLRVGRWTGPETLRHCREVCNAFDSELYVEGNAAQRWMAEFGQEAGIMATAVNTGVEKWDDEYGVEGLAVLMKNGFYILPSGRDGAEIDPEVRELAREMYDFDPSAHTGDRLMSCIAPGHLVTTRRGLVPIESVVVGDEVLTHLGRWRDVLATSCRHHDGDAVRIRPSGFQLLLVTPEHPVWSALPRANYADKSNRLYPDYWAFREASTLRAGNKLKGDYAFAPGAPSGSVAPVIDLADFVREPKKHGDSWIVEPERLIWRDTVINRRIVVDSDVATLIGLYIAEGFVRGKRDGHQVGFGFHARERHLVDFVKAQASRLFGANCFEEHKKGHGGVTVAMSSAIAARFFRTIGKHAQKALPWSWMDWPESLRLDMVAGWLCGDGCWSKRLSGVTIARQWLEQVRLTLHRAGLSSSVEVFKQSGTFRGKPCNQAPAWRIAFPVRESVRLVGRNALALQHFGDHSEDRAPTNIRSRVEGCGMAVRLASVGIEPYSGDVYDLQVAEDESFVVGGIAVHNCWICDKAIRAYLAPRVSSTSTHADR